ncbi:MAG: PhnD/SsuA/transferrin family substrate-binding protein [Candidatus Synoicihabitans palmerolidicus]|nr:PhnD/SsuA/transferrin family substrate-binding protein [Candidatus Synoicihabitans palmerolidicus]
MIEALANGNVDIAYLGTISFLAAQDRGPVELLAIGDTQGSFHYYSGLFTLNDSGIHTLDGIRGRSLARTDPSSSSGFVYPVA